MVHKITLMDAYLIETIRSAGISDEDIIFKFNNRLLEDYTYLHDDFNFLKLYELTDRGENTFEEIIKNGYEIMFLTFPGLKNLLKLKFQKLEKEDYEIEGYVISSLSLTEAQVKELRTLLSANWVIEMERADYIIKPVNYD